MPVAMCSRHGSNSPEWCITTSSHWGRTLRLAPRNSGTSVWTASSWPGIIRLAKAIAGSTTGRPWTAIAPSTRARVVQERLDAADVGFGSVGVLLAEVAGAGGGRLQVGALGAACARAPGAAAAQERLHAVVPLHQAPTEVDVDALVLGVEPVAAVAMGHLDDGVRACGRVEQRVDGDDGRGHAGHATDPSPRPPPAPGRGRARRRPVRRCRIGAAPTGPRGRRPWP